jgi:rod shape-determining protein MreD
MDAAGKSVIGSEQRSGGRLGLLFVVLALGFLHFALRPAFDTWFAHPNLLVCAALVSARRLRPGAATGVGFALGLLEDAMAVSHFGLATVLLVVLSYLGSRTRDLFMGAEPLFMGSYLAAGTFVYSTASYLLVGSGGDALAYLFVKAPLGALATGAIGYVTLPFVRTS